MHDDLFSKEKAKKLSRSCGSPRFARGFDGALHEIITVWEKKKSDRVHIRRRTKRFCPPFARGDEAIMDRYRAHGTNCKTINRSISAMTGLGVQRHREREQKLQ